MRTIKEVKEWIFKDSIDADPANGTLYVHRKKLLDFIESEPPCKHPNRTFMPPLQAAAYVIAGAFTRHPIKPVITAAKFCPDCGVDFTTLEENEKNTKKT